VELLSSRGGTDRFLVLSFDAPLTRLENHLQGTLNLNQPVYVVDRAMAKGPADAADGWITPKIAVSGYILRASVAYTTVSHYKP
jgi:hypothetical protein